MFKEIFAVDCENYKKLYIHILWKVFNVNVDGIYSNKCVLEG
jgi:hypothetical protein